jgi:hydroxypyruvate reductase
MNQTINELRDDAVAAFDAGVAAVQPANLIPDAVATGDGTVSIRGEPVPRAAGRTLLVAVGKAAPGLADAWLELVPGWADQVVVLAPHGVPVSDRVAATAEIHRGAHPYPDEDGEAAARRVLEIAASLGEDDLLMVLLSGGASALLAAPEDGLTLDDVRSTTRILLEGGATIHHVNAVRRQLLAAAGGGLARTAMPSRVVTLVLSDVLGDPLADIGSGPTVPSPTTAAEALGVLGGHGVVADVPGAVVAFLRDRAGSADDRSWTERSRVQVLANNRTAVEAAAGSLDSRGYHVMVHRGFLEGEASFRGRLLADFASAFRAGQPVALVAGGETTVTVRGSGVGGRNHELALAAAFGLDGPAPRVVLSAGTDGIDGIAAGAGAVVDPTTIARVRNAGIDPEQALADNDSATALAAAGDSIVTGPTGTNVCDLIVVLSG